MKQFKVGLGIIISVGAAWFAIQGINFSQVGDTFSRLNWWWLALSLIPYFLALAFKITRWQLLFKPSPKIALNRLWATLMISYLFNTVLPARLGEVVRGYALSRSEKISPIRVFSTILLEKILDIMMMVVFLLALLPFINISNDLRQAAFLTGGVVLVTFLFCVLMAAFRQQSEQIINFLLKFLPAVLRIKIFLLVGEILDVLSLLLNFKLSLNLWAQTLMLWLIVAVNYMFIAFALNIPLSFEVALVLMIALNLGMAVPSAPGYIGVFEALVKVALIPFFPGQESMLISLGLLLHIISYLPVIVLGAYYSSKEGLSLGKVTGTPAEELSSAANTGGVLQVTSNTAKIEKEEFSTRAKS